MFSETLLNFFIYIAYYVHYRGLVTVLIAFNNYTSIIVDKFINSAPKTPINNQITQSLNDDFTPLQLAISQGNLENARFLLANGVQVDEKNKDGFIPLHVAADRNDVASAIFLLDNGAQINTKNKMGNTALHVAGSCDNLEVAELLLQRGADINALNEERNSALHLAIFYNKQRMIKLLYEKGAKISGTNIGRPTALHAAAKASKAERARSALLRFAIKIGNLEMVKSCVENGAKIEQKYLKELEPSDRLVPENSRKIAQYLSKKAAELREKKKPEPAAVSVTTPVKKRKILEVINNTVKISELDGIILYGNMSKKLLNMGARNNLNDELLVGINFTAIAGQENLYHAAFDVFNKKSGKLEKIEQKTLLLKAIPKLAMNNEVSHFTFYQEYNKRYQEQSSLTFFEDRSKLYIKKGDKKKRNEKIFLFEGELKVSKPVEKKGLVISFIGNGGYKESVLFTQEISNKNEPEQIVKKIHPQLEQLLGHFSGSINNGWVIKSAEIKRLDLSQLELVLSIQNHNSYKVLQFKFHETDNAIKYLELNERTSFEGNLWQFYGRFEVELNESGALILSCENAHKNNIAIPFIITLRREVAIDNDDFPGFYEASGYIKSTPVQNNNNNSEPQLKLARAVAEEQPVLSNKRKKKLARIQARRLADEAAAKQTTQGAWEELLPGRDRKEDDQNRKHLELVQQKLHDSEEAGQDKEISVIETIEKKADFVERRSIAKTKDRQELSERPRIKLSPSFATDCPLMQGIWVGEGYTDSGLGYKMVPNKKIVLSLNNINGLPVHDQSSSWGSLWASALGQQGNYKNGKNIHWSFHYQPDGTQYLHISHHYLFEIRGSKKLGFYELHLKTDDETRTQNQVTMYLIKKLDAEEDDIINRACGYVGYYPNEALEKEREELLVRGYRGLVQELINLGEWQMRSTKTDNLVSFVDDDCALFNGVKIDWRLNMINEFNGEIYLYIPEVNGPIINYDVIKVHKMMVKYNDYTGLKLYGW